MNIIIPDSLLLKLETWCTTAWSKEVSGLGTIEIKDGDVHVTGVYALDMGSEGLTDIPPERIVALLGTGVNPAQLKLWWHRHPIGNGIPGQHNWSQTDEDTIQQAPLGSSPELVKWSVSIVRTPFGWVGRVDHYAKAQTQHMDVTQPLSAEEHAKLRALQSQGRIPTMRRRQYKPVSKQEKESIVDGVCKFLGAKIHRGGQKNWQYRKMAEAGLTQEALDEMVELLVDVPPEEISELYNVTLYDMRALGLITWDEMEEAMIDRYNKQYDQGHKQKTGDQQALWAD